jgi:glycosyltransferase involved in cell wall biosynthesis
VLFLGSGMAPNVQAARYLLDQVWPALQRRGAQHFALTVAGGVCSALAGRALPPGVQLAGVVADPATLYDTHGIVAAPVLSGGGLKIKVAEALGAGAAVVALPLAAEGLEEAVVQGALRVVDGPEAFADALLTLWQQPAAARQQGEAALHWARQRLSPHAAFAPLDALLASCETSRQAAAHGAPAPAGVQGI